MFYVRTSLKAGPFRFSAGKSGLGVSVGVPGFRVGTGPRGNYVRVAGVGVSYRASAVAPIQRPRSIAQPNYQLSQVEMADVTGVTSMSLVPTGSGDVVQQLNAAVARHRWGLPIAIAAGVLGLLTMPFGLVIWLLAIPACWWLMLRDKARRTVVLFYDVNDAPAAWFDAMVTRWASLTAARQLWREVRSGAVRTTYQHKTNAGADNLVSRISATAGIAGPRHLATNVAVPSVVAGGSSLFFLPDRLLLFENKHYTDISYQHLRSRGYSQRFIESSGRLPKDARQVGQTWQYVNVKGGPDRRYANNPILPIMLYGQVDFSSPQGLDWRLQISRSDVAEFIAQTLAAVPVIENPQ